MTRNKPIIDQYIGCLLSMAKATLYDHPTYNEAVDQAALDIALRRVHAMMMKEENRNANRRKGARLHISEVRE